MVKQRSKALARELGFPPEKMKIEQGTYHFSVAGIPMEAAGGADPKTGEITIYSDNIPNNAFEFKGVIAHEVEHQRYNTVLKEMSRERDELDKLVAGADRVADIINHDGILQPPYDKQFPVIHAISSIDQKQLMETDGVSDYSYTYWKAWAEGSGAASSAVHETLAEIARFDTQGIAERLIAVKQRPEWVKLYDLVNSTYDRLTNQSVSQPLAPKVEAERAKSTQEAS